MSATNCGLPDGWTLDDSKPQDVPLVVAAALDTIAETILKGGPRKSERRSVATLTKQLAALMRAWSMYGRWEPVALERARKAVRGLGDEHLSAVIAATPYGAGDNERLYAVHGALKKLIRALKSPTK